MRDILKTIITLQLLLVIVFSINAEGKELEEGMHLIVARKSLISNDWRPILTKPVYGGTEKILINANINEVESCAMDTPLCIFNYRKDNKCLRLFTEGEEIKDMRVTSWSEDCPEEHLQSQNQKLEFEDYPADEKYRNKNAPVVLSKKDRIYRTRLKEVAKQKPNFAGHYILTTWGCGMECLMGAVIDAKTGKTYQLPFTICCWGDETSANFKPIEFRTDSKLIVFTGARDEKEDDAGKHYYIFDNYSFKPIQ